jgi:hypothetical protein
VASLRGVKPSQAAVRALVARAAASTVSHCRGVAAGPGMAVDVVNRARRGALRLVALFAAVGITADVPDSLARTRSG